MTRKTHQARSTPSNNLTMAASTPIMTRPVSKCHQAFSWHLQGCGLSLPTTERARVTDTSQLKEQLGSVWEEAPVHLNLKIRMISAAWI